MELKVTKEKVLEAAGGCKEAERALKILFPEAFEVDDKYFDLRPLKNSGHILFDFEKARACGFHNNAFVQIRNDGKYAYKGFYLSDKYDWKIVKDELGIQVLLPLRLG